MGQLNWYRQFGLALTLFVLGSAAYWLEFKHKPEKEAGEEQTKHVFPLKETSVQSIKLTSNGKVFAFGCSDFAAKLCKAGDNSKWEVSEPVKVKADDANVNSLLSTLTGLTTSETIDLKDETPEKKALLLKEYGLDPASQKTARQVRVVTAAGESILYLGLPHPIGESIFAVKSGDQNRVYLIPNYFKSNLEHEFTFWRDKKLFALTAHEVESFQLEGSKAKLSAEKKDGQWILHVKGDTLTGDTENIDNTLSAATYLSAKDFGSDSKNDAKAKKLLSGLSQVLSLTLQKEKGTAKDAPTPAPMTLTLFQKKGQASGKLYAKVSHLDPLFELDPSSVGRLDKSVQDLRLSKLITSMERYGAKHLEFAGTPLGSSPLVMNSVDGKWINPADKAEIPSNKIQPILEKLTGNKIKEFLTGAAIPEGEKEGLKLTLGDEKTPAKRQLVFWKKGTKLYGKDLMSKQKDAFLIDSSLIDVLPWNKDFFKQAQASEGGSKSSPGPQASLEKK